jgi:hypothetical protein
MKPSEALLAHRTELRELVSRHGLIRPRIHGSVLTPGFSSAKFRGQVLQEAEPL